MRKHTPQSINKYLNEHIIGQDRAKKILSVAVYNHWKRLDNPDLGLRKSNVMLVGPSGSGKTLLVSTIAKLMGVPFYCGDATSLTAAGYVGADAETLIAGLVKAAHGDIDKAQQGIIFIDEFDKIKKNSSKSGQNSGRDKDVGGEAVQQALLKMLEGTKCKFPNDGDAYAGNRRDNEINTKNILFILGGAFVGLADVEETVTTEHLIDYGIIPEVLGRVPVVAQLKNLTRAEMRRVLTEVKNGPIEEYQNLFSTENVELEFCDASLDKIVDLAIQKNTGTRSLRSIIEDALTDLMFDVPSYEGAIKKIVITAGAIEKTEAPRLYKNEKSKRQQRRDRAKQRIGA